MVDGRKRERHGEHDDIHTGRTQHDNCRTLLRMAVVDDVIVGTHRGNIKKYYRKFCSEKKSHEMARKIA